MASGNVSQAVSVEGLAGMQKALRVVDVDVAKQLRLRLKDAGESIVAPVARRNAPVGVRSARYRFGGQDLRESIRVGATQKAASVYSTAVYGGVQNFGGRVGRHHATLLRRAQVSRYMSRAVEETRARTEQKITSILDWVDHELDGRGLDG